jgi:anaerobic magnesium-protoporphyrin IX monomethyl ester cyclase
MTGKQILGGLRASKIAKDATRVVWGGIHPTLEPNQTLDNKYVDIVVRGEGELTFPALVDALETGHDLREIAGVGFKENNGKSVLTRIRDFADMNSLPDLPYDKLDMERYITQREGFKRCLNIQSSRGCPHNCTFCINPVYNRCHWRRLSAEKTVERTEYLREKYKLDGIVYQEDNFFADVRRVTEFCRLMRERNIEIGWKANCRISYLAEKHADFLNMLEESGCRLLQFGVESGSDRILKVLNKRTTVDEIQAVNRELGKSNLKCRYNFMVGIPGETLEEAKMTLGLIEILRRENANLESCFVNIYTPWPGTELYWRSIKEGFVPPKTLEEWASFNWNETKMPWISGESKRFLESISKQYFGNTSEFFWKHVRAP